MNTIRFRPGMAFQTKFLPHKIVGRKTRISLQKALPDKLSPGWRPREPPRKNPFVVNILSLFELKLHQITAPARTSITADRKKGHSILSAKHESHSHAVGVASQFLLLKSILSSSLSFPPRATLSQLVCPKTDERAAGTLLQTSECLLASFLAAKCLSRVKARNYKTRAHQLPAETSPLNSLKRGEMGTLDSFSKKDWKLTKKKEIVQVPGILIEKQCLKE